MEFTQNYSPSTGYEATTFAYDDANRKVTITNQFSEVFALTRDVAQRLSRKDFASGVYETYAYDNRSRPTSIVVKNSSAATIAGQAYTYDPASNVATHTQDSVVTTYGYDPIGQLTSESRTGFSGAYTYDANGNRLTRALNGLTETYACDSGDKLTSVTWPGGTKTYGYDACGRTTSITTSAGTSTLAYDFEDRVTAIQLPIGGLATNTYNGLDTRIGRLSTAGVSFSYQRDGGYVIDRLLRDGVSAYTMGLSVRQGSSTAYQHESLLGFSCQSSPSQAVTGTKQYDAFGNTTAFTGTWTGIHSYSGTFRYQEDSDSGLYLLGHRYFEPSTGRFLSRDALHDDRNWYTYAHNRPTLMVDPDGLQALDSVNANWPTAVQLVQEGQATAGVFRAAINQVSQWALRRGIPLFRHAAQRAIERLDKLDDLKHLYYRSGGYWDPLRKEFILYSKRLGRYMVLDRKTKKIVTIMRTNKKLKGWQPIGRGFL